VRRSRAMWATRGQPTRRLTPARGRRGAVTSSSIAHAAGSTCAESGRGRWTGGTRRPRGGRRRSQDAGHGRDLCVENVRFGSVASDMGPPRVMLESRPGDEGRRALRCPTHHEVRGGRPESCGRSSTPTRVRADGLRRGAQGDLSGGFGPARIRGACELSHFREAPDLQWQTAPWAPG